MDEIATPQQALGASGTRSVRARLAAVFGVVGALHVAGWGTLLVLVAPRYPVVLPLGVLAYSFGLRHAFDADHISAIDNTTRKLLQQGGKPMAVGLFFSLGHSTVVFLMAVIFGIVAQAAKNIDQIRAVGSVVGASLAGGFLYLIAFVNLLILLDLVRIFREMRDGRYDPRQLDARLAGGGLLFRLIGPLFRLVTQSWHMYPIGLLFGLGFDTATEVSLLAVSAGAGSQGLPLYAIAALPVLFAAGMTLMDSADGVFMAQAYSWAFSNPIRKVYYNLTVTALSVLVALLVGTVELLSVLASQLHWRGRFWDRIGNLDLNAIGFAIVGLFAIVWLAALGFWKLQRVEERWGRQIRG